MIGPRYQEIQEKRESAKRGEKTRPDSSASVRTCRRGVKEANADRPRPRQGIGQETLYFSELRWIFGNSLAKIEGAGV